MKVKAILNNTYLQILIVIFFAGLFRLFFPDLIEFKYDEALSTFQTYLFYINPNVPQTGLIASTGMYNFPLFNYLLILIGLFSRSPQYLSFVIALINVGMIVLFYILNKKLFGKRVAFISAITLAISPWAIIFSRKIWAQDLILLFAIPFYYFFQKTLGDKKTQHSVAMFFFLFLLIQLHGSGIFLMVSVVVIFILYKINVNKLKVIKGLIFGSIFLIPYIIFELSSTPLCRDCVAFFAYQKLPRIFDAENFLRPFQILNGLNFKFLLGNDYDAFLKFSPFIQPILYIFIVEIFLLIGVSFYYFNKEKSKRYLLFPFTIIPALYLITRTPSYMHYYVIILPVVCLIYGLLFNYLYSLNKNLFYKSFITVIFLFFFFSKIAFMYSFFQFIGQKQNIAGDYGPVFKLTDQRVFQNTKQYSSDREFNVIRQYSYVYINTPIFHQKLGEYFMNTNKPILAVNEFQKALDNNKDDLYSKANLAYAYILLNNKDDALNIIKTIETQDSTVAAQLQKLLLK